MQNLQTIRQHCARSLRRAPLLAVVLGIALQLVACAMPIVPGASSESDVIAYFGKPIDSRELAGGNREFDYPRGPLGRENWRVTLSAEGRVVQVEQLLSEPGFARLTKGMSQAEVNRSLGRHFVTTNYANLNEQVWSWRYVDFGNRLMFFNAHFDVSSGLLKYTSRTPEFVNERRGRGSS
ncbi:MAG: hypothetical protein ACKVQK_20295 [Burkholderiales bacterium]